MTIPSIAPANYGPLLRLERARLLELLRSLPAEQWRLPTPCPEWDVLGLAVHLLGDDLSLVSRRRDDHDGTQPPAGQDESGFIAWLDDLQVEWVHAARRLSPRLTVELLDWISERVGIAIDGEDPSAVTASVSWADDRPVPVWLDQGRELSERWIHRQQILDAIGRPGDLRHDLASPVLQALRWAYPYRLRRHRRPPGTSIEIRIVDEQLQRRWDLVSDGSGWRFAPSGPPVAASVRMTADQAWRLLTNNHRADRHGRIEFDGDPDLVDTIAATRAMIGEPE